MENGNALAQNVVNSCTLRTQPSTVWSRKQEAVCVRHAYKHYGSKKKPNHVLCDLNMTVPKGTMYVSQIGTIFAKIVNFF